MKFNFKKIVPILTGAILLGSTIGLATSVAGADSYPADFASSVVVVGSASSDTAAANDIAADLGKLSPGTSLSGESVMIKSSSNNLNLGENLTEVRTTDFDHTDLPNLLAKETFQSKDGVSYDFEQTLRLAGSLYFTHFKDTNLKDEPVIGMKLASNKVPVANYTLRFTKDLESDVSGTGSSATLPDIQDSDLVMLGKTYKLLNAYNDSSGNGVKLELMGGAASAILEEGAKTDMIVNGVPFTVEISFIGSDKVKLIVNGEPTTSMVTGGTYKLKDGTQVGIRDILYTSKTGDASKVEFTLGAEKTTLEDGQLVKLNDVDVDGLYAHIATSRTSSKTKISSIKLEWRTNEKTYLTAGSVISMPGLNSFSIQQVGDLTVPLRKA